MLAIWKGIYLLTFSDIWMEAKVYPSSTGKAYLNKFVSRKEARFRKKKICIIKQITVRFYTILCFSNLKFRDWFKGSTISCLKQTYKLKKNKRQVFKCSLSFNPNKRLLRLTGVSNNQNLHYSMFLKPGFHIFILRECH